MSSLSTGSILPTMNISLINYVRLIRSILIGGKILNGQSESAKWTKCNFTKENFFTDSTINEFGTNERFWHFLKKLFFNQITSVQNNTTSSVTRFGDISSFWQYFKSLRRLRAGLLSIGPKFEPALANILWHWANIYYCKLPKINK